MDTGLSIGSGEERLNAKKQNDFILSRNVFQVPSFNAY